MYSNQFFNSIGIDSKNQEAITKFSKKTGIPKTRLIYYNQENILPSGKDLETITNYAHVTEMELMLKMGRFDKNLLDMIQDKAGPILEIIKQDISVKPHDQSPCELSFQTDLGKLYRGDCIDTSNGIESDSVDLIFADPPFNLNKLYPSNIDDNLRTDKYLRWCQEWLNECIRILKPGGGFFLWNLPKWNVILADFIGGRLNFKHWIAVDIKYTLPIPGRLYPSHYSMLYYVKGEKPRVFHPDRLPMQICPHCTKDLKDYGGYKNKMNPKGVNLTDIWLDIPPVRHKKYKRRNGANELSLKLLDRVIEMASNEGDLIFDPFGGSGTTYIAAELKNRKWIGCEIGPVDDIINRFERIDEETLILNDYRKKLNALFPDEIQRKRQQLGLWTCESVREKADPLSKTETSPEGYKTPYQLPLLKI